MFLVVHNHPCCLVCMSIKVCAYIYARIYNPLSFNYNTIYNERLRWGISMEKVGIYIFPNVEESDFVGVFEVLAKSRSMKDEGKLPIEKPLQVDILASENMITCANGLVIKPHKVTDDFEDYDLLIVPGGRGVTELLEDTKFLKRMSEFARNRMICSVCTGALILGKAGLLEGKKATTHHNAREALREFCEVVDSRVCIDGNVISAGGVSCSLDLGLKILEITYGKKIAEMVANRMEIPTEMISFE